MKICITGLCGFAGSAIARHLRAALPQAEIFGLDSLVRPGTERNRRLDGVRIFHGDMRCASDVDALPQADWVIDAAAQPSVLAGVDGRSSSRQLVEHNLLGTLNLLEYCKQHGAGIILLSTSRVYSVERLAALPLESKGERFVPVLSGKEIGIGAAGLTENFSTAAPVSLYGATKISSEVMALEYGRAFDFPVLINRCGVLAGAGQFGTAEQGIFSYWLHAWAARRELRYLGFGGHGHQVRDALHVDDLAALILQQITNPTTNAPAICHVAGGLANAISLRELSAWCERRFGPHEVIQDGTPRPFDLPWVVLDSSLTKAAWSWEPQRTLGEILEEIARHAEENPHWLELSQP